VDQIQIIATFIRAVPCPLHRTSTQHHGRQRKKLFLPPQPLFSVKIRYSPFFR
jgi:hypothetical protein